MKMIIFSFLISMMSLTAMAAAKSSYVFGAINCSVQLVDPDDFFTPPATLLQLKEDGSQAIQVRSDGIVTVTEKATSIGTTDIFFMVSKDAEGNISISAASKTSMAVTKGMQKASLRFYDLAHKTPTQVDCFR